MLMDPTMDSVEKVKLVDCLCRLGVSYHFLDEIEDNLSCFFQSHSKLIDNDYDLCMLALMFRVLRQHGFNVSSSKYI